MLVLPHHGRACRPQVSGASFVALRGRRREAEAAISRDGGVRSSTTCASLVHIGASHLPIRECFLLAASGRAGGRGKEVLTRIGREMRSVELGAMVQMGMGASAIAAVGDRITAWVEKREPTGHSCQPGQPRSGQRA
jgi:hypothetical protein